MQRRRTVTLYFLTGFPSPCGVNIVGNVEAVVKDDAIAVVVSVPLRGKYCRELIKAMSDAEVATKGFRPLAG